jgi:membrane peptidoglycan carboxypeptidase
VKAPSAFDPTTKGGYPQAVDRRNYVIQNMVEIGAITPEQAAAAKKAKLTVTGKRAPNGCVATNRNHWGFFCDYFYRWWLTQETFGATGYERERRLKSGGYRIITTLDVGAQEAAKRNVEAHLKTGHKEALMLAAVEPGTGRVRAMAVNRNFKLDSQGKNGANSDPAKRRAKVPGTYPNTTNPLMTGGGDITGYQAGSTFKMFTLVAALEKGYPLAYTINAPYQYKSKYPVAYNSPAACPRTNDYCPVNFSKDLHGVFNMWTAFGKSVNTFFVPLEERVGADNVVDVAKRLGIKFRVGQEAEWANNRDYAEDWGAFTLGVSSTTPLDLANAYATLAADGKYCEPTPVQEIRGQDGKKLDVANPRCNQAVSAQVARAAVDAARCPVGDRSDISKCNGTTARATRGIVDRPIAGKTGTTDHDKTASLVVMTKQLAVAGILADPDWAETTERMNHDIVNPAVQETLRDAMAGKPGVQFTPPSGKIVEGDQKPIPDVRCWPVDRARNRLKDAGFEVDISRDPIDSPCPANTVAGTNPTGRTIKGGTVVVEISNGKATGPTPPPNKPGRRGPGGGGPIVLPPPPG